MKSKNSNRAPATNSTFQHNPTESSVNASTARNHRMDLCNVNASIARNHRMDLWRTFTNFHSAELLRTGLGSKMKKKPRSQRNIVVSPMSIGGNDMSSLWCMGMDYDMLMGRVSEELGQVPALHPKLALKDPELRTLGFFDAYDGDDRDDRDIQPAAQEDRQPVTPPVSQGTSSFDPPSLWGQGGIQKLLIEIPGGAWECRRSCAR